MTGHLAAVESALPKDRLLRVRVYPAGLFTGRVRDGLRAGGLPLGQPGALFDRDAA